MSLSETNLQHTPRLPLQVHPICVIGAGGIVKDAHLPAYKLAGFKKHGIVNRSREKAEALAQKFHIECVYDDLEQMIASAPENAVYDLPLPADYFAETLRALPDNSVVSIQKPMGENLAQAVEILHIKLLRDTQQTPI